MKLNKTQDEFLVNFVRMVFDLASGLGYSQQYISRETGISSTTLSVGKKRGIRSRAVNEKLLAFALDKVLGK